MIRKNSNNEIVFTRTGISLMGVLVTAAIALFSFFTYTLGRATQQTEELVSLQYRMNTAEKEIETIKSEISEIRKILEDVRSDIKVIKFRLGLSYREGIK